MTVKAPKQQRSTSRHPRLIAGGRVSTEIATRRRQERFADARWLIEMGTHPDELATRLGTTRSALERQAERWGADDIATHMRHMKKSSTCTECGAAITSGSARCRPCHDMIRYGPHRRSLTP